MQDAGPHPDGTQGQPVLQGTTVSPRPLARGTRAPAPLRPGHLLASPLLPAWQRRRALAAPDQTGVAAELPAACRGRRGPREPLLAGSRGDCLRPTALPPTAPRLSQVRARREVAQLEAPRPCRPRTHAGHTHDTPRPGARPGPRSWAPSPHCPLGVPLLREAPLAHWARLQPPTGAPMDQSRRPDLHPCRPRGRGCEEARGGGGGRRADPGERF